MWIGERISPTKTKATNISKASGMFMAKMTARAARIEKAMMWRMSFLSFPFFRSF